jgi:hypothetical protein
MARRIFKCPNCSKAIILRWASEVRIRLELDRRAPMERKPLAERVRAYLAQSGKRGATVREMQRALYVASSASLWEALGAMAQAGEADSVHRGRRGFWFLTPNDINEAPADDSVPE